jgi:hypothetical protein
MAQEPKPTPAPPPAAEQKPAPEKPEANQDLPLNQDGYPPALGAEQLPYFDAAGTPKVPKEIQNYEYVHAACSTEGRMDNRTYYLWYCYPWLVTGLYCTHCRSTFRVGEDGEMDWKAGGKAIPPVDTVPYHLAPVPGAPGFYTDLKPAPDTVEMPPAPPAPEPGAK